MRCVGHRPSVGNAGRGQLFVVSHQSDGIVRVMHAQSFVRMVPRNVFDARHLIQARLAGEVLGGCV